MGKRQQEKKIAIAAAKARSAVAVRLPSANAGLRQI